NPWTDYPRKGNFPAELSTSFGAKRTRLGRSLALFLLSRAEVHEALSQPASVVARRDNQQPRRGDRSGDRGLSGAADRVEVFAVDDDFHHRSALRREPRFLTEFVTQRRAERLVGAGDGELVAAASLRPRRGDAAGKRQDHVGASRGGLSRPLGGQQSTIK